MAKREGNLYYDAEMMNYAICELEGVEAWFGFAKSRYTPIYRGRIQHELL